MYKLNKNKAIHQGDIFRDILLLTSEYDPTEEKLEEIEPVPFNCEYIIVLSQECDLFWDEETRKRYSSLTQKCTEISEENILAKDQSEILIWLYKIIEIFEELQSLEENLDSLKKIAENGLLKFKEDDKKSKLIRKGNSILEKIKEYLHEDQFLSNILVAPIYLTENFKKGEQISGKPMKPRRSEMKDIEKNDKHKRFHYLKKNESPSVPESVIDFKHFFTIPRDTLYVALNKGNYLATLKTPFKESLSQRFAYYLSRIGLPSDNKNIK